MGTSASPSRQHKILGNQKKLKAIDSQTILKALGSQIESRSIVSQIGLKVLAPLERLKEIFALLVKSIIQGCQKELMRTLACTTGLARKLTV